MVPFSDGRGFRMVCALGVAVALAGCAGGAMGQVQVSDGCPADDPKCLRSELDAPIAVGATVTPKLEVDLRGSGAPGLHFESANERVLYADRGKLAGKAAGVAALLLVSDRGTVLDFIHVWVKEPTGIRLTALAADGASSEPLESRIEMLPGESVRLAATLHGDGQELAGDAAQTWTLDAPVAAVLEDGRSGRRRLVAVSPGKATLKITSLDQVVYLDVVVRDLATLPVASASKKGGA